MSTDHLQWVLTDLVHTDTWLDSWSVHSSQIPGHHPATPWKLSKRTLRGGVRDAIDVVEIDNGPLQLSLLPTRGMGIWKGNYQGLRLGWDAPTHGPVHPSLVRLEERGGLGWLTGFHEWICRCGLSFNGPPGKDQGQSLTLHGRIANQPAHFVGVRVEEGPPYTLTVVGRLQEACLFGGHLHLTSSVSTTPGSNRFKIHDIVENRSVTAAEMQLLYHCNFGPPLLGEKSRVAVPARKIAPRDAWAAERFALFDVYDAPTPGLREIVNYYEPWGDKEGRSLAVLHTADLRSACAVRFSTSTLPYLAVWKYLDAPNAGYVTGLEPATGFPNFKAVEREQGRVVILQPGQTWETTLDVEIHVTREGVEQLLREVAHVQGSEPPQLCTKPNPNWGG